MMNCRANGSTGSRTITGDGSRRVHGQPTTADTSTASPAWAARMKAIWRSQELKFSITDSGERSRISRVISPSPVSDSHSRCGNSTTRATRLASHGSVECIAARARLLAAVNSASTASSSSPA